MKILTLSNEEAMALYNFFQKVKLDKVKNRIRWKFLENIENQVIDLEEIMQKKQDEIQSIREEGMRAKTSPELTLEQKDAKSKEVLQKLIELNKEVKDIYEKKLEAKFNDRENYLEAVKLFETVTGDDLTNRDGKIYKQIEDAFLNVVDTDSAPKATVPAPTPEKGVN